MSDTKLAHAVVPSNHEATKCLVSVRDRDVIFCASNKNSKSSSSANTISPVPSNKNIKCMNGRLLTPLPGRLTPTGQGRIKAPPVCIAPSLRSAASTIEELNTVCFSQNEAASCAEKALALDSYECVEEKPLNVDKLDNIESTAFASSTCENRAQLDSSNSTIVTMSSASSCGGSVFGNEIAFMALVMKKDPPLEVIQTDLAFTSEDEQSSPSNAIQNRINASTALTATDLQSAFVPQRTSDSTLLSKAFTENLVKGNSSRQGRSLQRWLIHSSTDELVRQVAGTIPITRDGRIILVSASRKAEWILPKGGWDEDETKEECAARETFEEAGLLGQLGGCLEPIDYETAKAKKRRLSKQGNGAAGVADKMKRSKRAGEGMHPPLSKCAKTDKSMSPVSAGLGLEAGLSESVCCSGASNDKNTAVHQPSTPAMTTLFDPKNHSYVRLFLFPLYVSSVKSEWPEKGRLRKLVDIDEAIKIMDAQNRLYFKNGLEMVKERGLHLLAP